tara:strand:+ start:3019 stop:3453 length:435 start_codon:yes stop_codon:yes gene_type:complete
MAQQNKKPEVDSRRAALEASLLEEDESENRMGIETGRRHVEENSKFQRKQTRDGRALRIKSGLRRRHPGNSLNRFSGMNATSSQSASLWEKALLHETKRVDMPKEFRVVGDSDGMVNQMGIVSVALDNYKASKQKFSRLHLIGS